MITAENVEFKKRDGTWSFECPVNKEAREAKIRGTRTWEDLEDKARIRKGGCKVEAFFGKVISSKGWDKDGRTFTNLLCNFRKDSQQAERSRLVYLRLLLMYPGAAMYVSTTRCTIEKKKKKGRRMGKESCHLVYIPEDRQRTSREMEEAHWEDRE